MRPLLPPADYEGDPISNLGMGGLAVVAFVSFAGAPLVWAILRMFH